MAVNQNPFHINVNTTLHKDMRLWFACDKGRYVLIDWLIYWLIAYRLDENACKCMMNVCAHNRA